eukprot:1160675-Pelagomonas_calceolata.AAC.2
MEGVRPAEMLQLPSRKMLVFSGPDSGRAFLRAILPGMSASLKWNSKGTALLVLSFSDFDATNQSYYGEQKLHFMLADPAKVHGRG